MTDVQNDSRACEQPVQQPSVEDVVRLGGALHLLRFALDRFIRAEFKPAPEYLRDLLDRVTNDPGEPCDRAQQYTRAEAAEATVTRVRAEVARIRLITPTWGPVADLIEAAIDDPDRPKEQRARPTHLDGTPYSYAEIVAAGWGHCDGCGMWTTATPDRPHQCSVPAMANETTTDGEEATDV